MLEGYLDKENSFSKRWLLQILEGQSERYRKLAGLKELLDTTSYVLSEDQGYMSTVYLVKLLYHDESIELCLKVPTFSKVKNIFETDEKEKNGKNSELHKLKGMHNNECNFYRLFTEHHVEGFKILKVYSLKHIDEDFSISPHILMDFCPNTASVHLKDTLNQGQLEAIAEQIALMHSYIIGNDVYIDEDLFKPFDYNNSFSEEEAEKFGFLLNTKVEECGDEILIENYKKCKYIVDNKKFFEYCIKKHHFDLNIKPVLCHGDLWANNVLFDIDDDGKISKDIVAFIDFQLANVGNPAQDLTRILVINCDEDVRRANEQQIFEFYYEKLTFYLKKYNRKPPFSFEKLLLASKSQHVAQTIFSLFFIAFLFEAPEKQKYRPLFIRRARYIFEDCYNIAHKHFAHLLT